MQKTLHHQYIIADISLHLIFITPLTKSKLMCSITKVFGICSLLWLPILCISQDYILGTPNVVNHTSESYGAGNQNWDANYKNGQIFFANNGGLLSYNGINWDTRGMANNTIVRSVAISSDNRIYSGAQNEIGVFKHNENGILEYTNLLAKFREQIDDISEVWDIEILSDKLYFTTDNHVNCYYNDKITRYGRNSIITNMNKLGDEIWYHSSDEGIYIIKDTTERFLAGSEFLNNLKVIEMLRVNPNMVYIVTEKNGIFTYNGSSFSPWDNNASNYLKEKRTTSAYYDPDHGLFIGTYIGGLVSFSNEGLVKLMLNKQNGLQSNSINCMTITPNGVLWVGTNKGIDEIDLAANQNRFFPDGDLEGAVYDIDIWNKKFFFSTSNGLYSIDEKSYYNPLEGKNYQLIPGTLGQTWSTDIIDGQLYCAHHEGPMKITKNLIGEKISQETGAWQFVRLSEKLVAIGSYYGVSLYTINENKSLSFKRKITSLNESSRIMVYDENKYLWVSHPYKNVYRISFSDDYNSETIKVYTGKDGFQREDRNYVFDINDLCYLTNASGIYKYNSSTDRFEKDKLLNDEFDAQDHVRRIIQQDMNIWCISDHHTTQFQIVNEGLERSLKRKDLKNINTGRTYIGGFEELFPYNENTVFLSSKDGAVEYKMNTSRSPELKVSIKSISLPMQNDSIVYGGYGSLPNLELEQNENAIRINFHTEYANSHRPALYSFILLENDEEWSMWSTTTTKDYTNLEGGNYEFLVRATAADGQISEVESLKFSIAHPWYNSFLARLLLALIVLLILLAIFLIPRKKYKANTAILEAERKKTIEEMERVKKEKLLSEIKFKNKELASSTLHLLQKNQTLTTLRVRFDDLNSKIKNPEVKKELNNILSIFRSDLREDEDWDKFSFYFDEVHQDFLKKLKNKYPQLSANDQKLCAYLKMNLSTKEIAPLLNISIRGVEISRYRLRKKLNLERTQVLNDFLNQEF